MNFKVILQNTGATWAVNIILLLLGFILLVKGADFFVDGAAGIAKKLKISTFIIGVTVVAIGTSVPELAVTIVDAVKPKGGAVIIGNIIGSNALNILLILGISALICKLPSEKSTRTIDMPFLIFVSALFLVLGVFVGGFDAGTVGGALYLDATMTWYCGLILILLYVGFMVYNILLARKQSKARLEQATAVSMPAEAETAAANSELKWYQRFTPWYEKMKLKTWFLAIIAVFGLGMVVLGAQVVVDSATVVAENLIGIPTEIVALTVVAFGTSLPELITSISAARKGDTGIATGNIIGSNIANILLIGGVGALCRGSYGLPFTMEGLIGGIVSVVAALLIFVFTVGSKTKSLGRVAGIVMLMCLVGYYTLLFVNLGVRIYV
ncbi:MAG: calcium/sodium antiporter [Clostridiales bacterium]|nr:calcium/sodium antiporter [Clostridiales bacterium]